MPPKPKNPWMLGEIIAVIIMLGGSTGVVIAAIVFNNEISSFVVGDKTFPAYLVAPIPTIFIGEIVALRTNGKGLLLALLKQAKSAWDGRNGKQS